MIRVAIIDDHYVVRVGLKTIIDMDPELQFVGEASSGEGAAAFVMTAKPDVLLLDIRMPGKDGIETLADILAAKPSQKVVMLTTSDADDEVFRALNKGAQGYLLKDRDSDAICMAVKTVHAGSKFIPDAVKEIYRRRQMMAEPTPREREVLELVADGLSNDEVANRLGISYESVKVHMKHLLSKFEARDRTELVSAAIRGGFVKEAPAKSRAALALVGLFLMFASSLFAAGPTSATAIDVKGAETIPGGRVVLTMNDGWEFKWGKDKTVGEWKSVDLPHDAQFEQPWTKNDSNGARGFKPMGEMWYRKRFSLPWGTGNGEWGMGNREEGTGKRVFLELGGLLCVGDVYVNGKNVGGTDYGYLPVWCDITDALKTDGDNVIEVWCSTGKLGGSRWYTGAGLYRGAKLVVKPKVSIARHGVFVKSKLVGASLRDARGRLGTGAPTDAAISISVELDGFRGMGNNVALDVIADIKDASGKVVASTTARAPWSKLRHQEVELSEIALKDAKLWDIDSPNLYTADVRLVYNGSEIDREEVRFGVRKIEMNHTYGLKLNGRKVFLASMSNHHDLGLVGAAAYPRAIRRQFEAMKKFGYNAIRCSHNPYSEEFYDLADEMGLLVLDELIDKWSDRGWWFGRRPFTQIWPQLVTDWIKRDRNHPSVFAWSFGNELQMNEDLCGYQCLGDWGVTMYRLMKTLTQRWDPTRPTTVAMFPAQKGARGKNDPKCEGDPEPPELAVATDFASFNYRWMDYASYVKHEPQMNIFQSEAAVSELQAPFVGMDREHSIGCSWWGAVEYWGESNGWPKKGWSYAVFSHALEPFPSAYLLKSVISDEPVVRLAVETGKGESEEWNDVQVGVRAETSAWEGKHDEKKNVRVYTNCESVELFLNGKSLGSKANADKSPRGANVVSFEVPFEPGELKAVGKFKVQSSKFKVESGKCKVESDVSHSIRTAGEAVALAAEVEGGDFAADGQDLIYVRCRIVDANGTQVRRARNKVSFSCEGAAKFLACDNGDHYTDELFTSDLTAKRAKDGFILAAFRTGTIPGEAKITIKPEGLPVVSLTVPVGRAEDSRQAAPFSLQAQIDAAAANGGGRVVVPAGEYISDGPIRLRSNVELHLAEGAKIVFSDDPKDYLPVVPTSWEGVECLNYSPLVYAYGCTNVAITGKGTIAPKMDFWRTWFGHKGRGLRAATRKLYDWCSFNAPIEERDLTKLPESNVRPHLIQFNRCANVRLEDFKIRESPFWTIHLYLCDGVVARGLDVYAHGSNNDGIDIEMTKNVLVENCRFDQGDDAVVIKSGRNQDAWRLACPSENIEVRNCTVVNGHVLLGIGSEMSGGVRNVYMHDCALESEALRLFYVKTNERRGGFVENIRMENVKAKKVRLGVMAVETDVLYQWKDFPTHEVRVTPIRNLSMKNVVVDEAERLVDIRGDKRLPVDGITLENVRVVKALKPDRIENAVNVRVNAEGEAAARRGPAAFAWPEPTQTMKPWVYNWWMGSAVDKAGLEFQCRELKDKGFGGFHVIPIYGAKGGYEKNWKPLLSPQWIEAWNLAAGLASYNGLGIDLTMGSGWCFGGPWIDKEHAASSGMKVKRAGLGGTGYMLDPFDPEAMKLHVAQFDKWFGKAAQNVTCDSLASGDILVAARPRAFYHDSYEYYGAEPKKGGDVDESQLACFKVWTDWCRENGYLTRNEAHGAPSNWLDFYALADIPETEMFGKNDRDILVSKFASSAAHVKGTRLVSAESCTWIDEHFCERPAEIKAFLDRLFLSGVNHVFYHGCCYSPVEAVWPGWCFYASLEMNPRNPIWREMGALNAYVTRCQSLFQTWTPDNDLAILWDPASFRAKHADKVENMNIHHRTGWFYGEPIGKVAEELYAAGYAFDYVSPRMVAAGLAGKYAALVDPAAYLGAEARKRAEMVAGAKAQPFGAACGLLATRWRKEGATAYFVVNTGSVARVVSAAEAFTAADPLSGAVRKTRAAEIGPLQSLFVVGDGFGVAAAGAAPETGTEIAGPWQVSALCGGPELPAPRALDRLAGWETFDAFFSGTMLYRTGFDAGPASARRTISLGEVREIARVRLNGRDLGVKFMPPYDFEIPDGVLKEKGNELEVEVTNLGANRLRWNDLNGVDWKYFDDINMVDINYKKFDASKWKPMPSGLLGPVRLSVPSVPPAP